MPYITITLSREHRRFLEQEKKRIRRRYGYNASIAEIVRVLIEQHHMRMTHIATAMPESVEWYYRYLKEDEDD